MTGLMPLGVGGGQACLPPAYPYGHEGGMLKKGAVVVVTIIFVFVLLPVLVFVACISVQEGCLVCFEGAGRGGPFEAILNAGIAVGLGWAGYKLFQRFVMP